MKLAQVKQHMGSSGRERQEQLEQLQRTHDDVVDRLNKQIAELQQAQEHSQQRWRITCKQLEQAMSEAQDARTDVELIEEQLATTEGELLQARERVGELERLCAERAQALELADSKATRQLEQSRQELALHSSAVSELTERVEHLAAQCSDLSSKLDLAQKQLAAVHEAHAKELQARERQVEERHLETVDRLGGEVDRIQAQYDELLVRSSADLQRLEQQLRAQTTRTEDLESELASARQQHAQSLEGHQLSDSEQERLRLRIGELELLVANQSAARSAAEQAISEANEALAVLRSSSEALALEHERCAIEHQSHLTNIADAQHELGVVRTSLEQLELVVNERNEQLAAASRTIAEATKRISELESALNDTRSSLELELSTVRNQLAAATDGAESAQRETAFELEHARQREQTLQNELSQQSQAYEQRLAALVADTDRLTSELQQATLAKDTYAKLCAEAESLAASVRSELEQVTASAEDAKCMLLEQMDTASRSHQEALHAELRAKEALEKQLGALELQLRDANHAMAERDEAHSTQSTDLRRDLAKALDGMQQAQERVVALEKQLEHDRHEHYAVSSGSDAISSERDVLRDTAARLEQRLEQLSEQLAHATEQRIAAEQALVQEQQAAHSQAEDAQHETIRVRTELEQTEQLLRVAQSTADSAQAALERYSARASELELELARANATSTEKLATAERCRIEDLARVQDDLTSCMGELQDARQQCATLADLDRRFEAQAKSLSLAQEALESERTRATELSAQVDELSKQLTAHCSRELTAREQSSTLESSLTTELERIRLERDRLADSNSELAQQRTINDKLLHEYVSECEQLRARIAELESAAAAEHVESNRLHERIEELEHQVEEQTQEFTHVQRQQNRAESQYEQVQQLENKARQANSELLESRTQLREQERQLSQLSREREKLEHAVEQSSERVRELEGLLEAERKRVSLQQAESTNELARLRDKAREYKSKVAELQQLRDENPAAEQLGEARQALEHERSQCAALRQSLERKADECLRLEQRITELESDSSIESLHLTRQFATDNDHHHNDDGADGSSTDTADSAGSKRIAQLSRRLTSIFERNKSLEALLQQKTAELTKIQSILRDQQAVQTADKENATVPSSIESSSSASHDVNSAELEKLLEKQEELQEKNLKLEEQLEELRVKYNKAKIVLQQARAKARATGGSSAAGATATTTSRAVRSTVAASARTPKK